MRRLNEKEYSELDKDKFRDVVIEYAIEYFDDLSDCITISGATLGNYLERIEQDKAFWNSLGGLSNFVSSTASLTINIQNLSCFYKNFGLNSEKNHEKFLEEMYLVFDFFRMPQTIFSLELNFLN
jgi:hypothetical protein